MATVKTGLVFLATVILFMSCSSKMTEEEYYNAAKESYGNSKFEEAINNFKLIIDNYPKGKRSAEASFMLGFINANDLENFEDAEKYYKAFLEKYPQHDLADDAQYELNTLGKDINELPIFQNLAADSLAEQNN